MKTTTTKKRNITKEDVLLKTRLLAECARLEVKGPPLWQPTIDGFARNPRIVLDGCEITVAIRPNPRSRLQVVIDGNDVTISEMGELLGPATLLARPSWRDKLMSDGRAVNSVIGYDAGFVGTVLVSNRCAAYDSGKVCKYCGLGYMFAQSGPIRSFSETLEAAERQIEALVIAIQSGWRGVVLFVGGGDDAGATRPMDDRCIRSVHDPVS